MNRLCDFCSKIKKNMTFFLRIIYPEVILARFVIIIRKKVVTLCVIEIFRCNIISDVQRPILEWKGWVVPSRLSYCTYLIHVNIIHILLGARTQLGHVSFFYVVRILWNSLFTILLLFFFIGKVGKLTSNWQLKWRW